MPIMQRTRYTFWYRPERWGVEVLISLTTCYQDLMLGVVVRPWHITLDLIVVCIQVGWYTKEDWAKALLSLRNS